MAAKASTRDSESECRGTGIYPRQIDAVGDGGCSSEIKAVHYFLLRRQSAVWTCSATIRASSRYAEMGSVNPVVVLSSVTKNKADVAAKQLAASITLGSGQFCTNPGLVLLLDEPGNGAFLEKVGTELNSIKPAPMLTSSIRDAYLSGIQHQAKIQGITRHTQQAEGLTSHMHSISAADAIKNPDVLEEVFGPSSVAVISSDMDELLAFCNS